MSFLSFIKESLAHGKRQAAGQAELGETDFAKPLKFEDKAAAKGTASLLHTKIPKVFGINRKATLTLLILFGLFFWCPFCLEQARKRKAVQSLNSRPKRLPQLAV